MKRILNRLAQSVLVMLLVSVLCFGLVKLAPGDPVLTYVQPNMSEAYVARIRADMGLDKPIPLQYLLWMRNILHGNFGHSLINNRPVLQQILERLPATLLLSGVSLLLALLLSVPLGLFSGKYKNGVFDRVTSMFAYVGVSIPAFWFGILLIYAFGVYLHWLPTIGMHSDGDSSPLDLLRHFILPCAVLTFTNIAQFSQYIRSSTITELSNDYVLVQRASGMKERDILFRHVLKNALLPLVTIMGMSLQNIVSGAIITEQVFAWPGTGQLSVTAVTTFDYPLIMGITMFTAVVIVIGNLLADILYTVVDPRIRA